METLVSNILDWSITMQQCYMGLHGGKFTHTMICDSKEGP